MISIQDVPWTIIQLHDQSLALWVQTGNVQLKATDLLVSVEKNHAYNYQLWLAEDQARRDDLGFEYVYSAKRAIDTFNQQRNNMMEAIDDVLIALLTPITDESCPIHSETPGMMIDRLSILTLKYYHMSQQLLRGDVNVEHVQICQQKSMILLQQRQQLAQCLQDLFIAVIERRRTFKIYRQFKMYNDATLNPALYS